MKILVVDDSPDTRILLKASLEKNGFTSVLLASSAVEALDLLALDSGAARRKPTRRKGVDLVLMDIHMPEMDGIEATRQIKNDEKLRDVPVIMVTGNTNCHNLEKAFEAGAIDYIKKPINQLELLARVRSVLFLKAEMDCRKAREKELGKLTKTLMGANRRLESLARLDPLTGLPSRRIQDEAVEDEWRRSRRERKPLTFLIADIDCFKTYNESYGHEMGDSCLKVIAEIMASGVRRPGDMVARYGGDKFAAILPGVAQEGAAVIAEKFRKGTHELKIIHKKSEVSNLVTISVGVASVIPNDDNSLTDLIKAANQALCRAKLGGRNKVVI